MPTPPRVDLAPLPPPGLATSPPAEGVTGLETGVWFTGATAPVEWAQAGTLGTRSDCTQYRQVFGGYRAAPSSYTWDFGENLTTSSEPGSAEAWAATHLYETKGDHVVGVAVTWSVTGSPAGGGNSDVVGTSRPYPVIEIRSVLTG